MRKMTLLWILLILSIGINGLEIAYENNLIEISGDFEIKEFIIKTIAEEEFYQPIIVQCTNGGKIGEAEIPFCSKYVSLPDNGNFVINNLSFGFDEQVLDKKIVPAGWEDNLLPNKAFYQKNEWLPEEIIKISEPNIMSGFRFSQVTISPIQYNPALNKIRIIKNIQAELEVDFSVNNNPITNVKSTFSRSFSKIVKENVLGAEDKRSVGDGLYLFIAPDNCETNLQPLLRWKEKLGFKTRFAPISETGNTNTNILNYLQNAYDNWEIPPEFVVLVGDVSGNIVVPSNYINYGSWISPVNVTDHTYTLLEGDDYFPDIMIGRLSLQDQFQLQTIVSKITNYEGNPYIDENWFTEALMVGFVHPNQGQYSHRETLMAARQKLLDFTYTVVDTFIHPWQSGASLLGQMINGGYTFINFRGAGGPSYWASWASSIIFEIWDIQNLTNGFMLPMVTSMTCGGGDFAVSSYPSCFGETWLNEGSPSEPKGAIGFIGPSEWDTKTGWNNANDLGIYQGITRENLFRSSEMLLRGKMELYNNYPYCHAWGGPTESDRFYFYVYNLLGDPGLAVWTDIPKDVNLTYDDEMIYGSNFLEVQVNTLTSDNSDFIIAVTNEDSLIATGITDFDGKAQIFLNLPIGDYEVTASKYGYIPETEDLFVYEGDILSLVDFSFIEETVSGQLVNLEISIQNMSNIAVTNVSISLTSEDIYLDIIFGEIIATSIGAGEIFYGEFQFQIGNEWKNDYLSSLFVNVSSTFGDQSFIIPVEITSPELALSQFIVDNTSGCLIQNETVDVNIELLNCGNLETGTFDVNLVSLNEKTEVIISNGSYFNISVNGTGMNSSPFQISVNDVITGELAKYSLEIYNNGTFLQELIFTIPIGNIDQNSPTFSEYGYYAIESDDVGNFQAPVYNWIEIAPQLGGQGTLIGADHTTVDGYTKVLYLPFTFTYFGQYYNTISVNSNGYLSMGGTDLVFFRNRNIPSGIGPDAMIAPFWDDLKNGQMYGYYDENNHYFIIEWLDFQNSFNTDYHETFQAILYDPLYYSTPTGDGEILFQYKEVNNIDQNGNYATVGIENEMQDSGLLITFANIYQPTTRPLEDETAILFTINEGLGLPYLSVMPEYLNVSIPPDTTIVENIFLTNNGEIGTELTYEISVSHFSDRNLEGGRSIENDQIIRGSNGYIPILPMNLLYYLYHNSPDGEPVYGVRLDFPDGFYVNSASDLETLNYNNETGNGVEVSWGFGNGTPLTSVGAHSFNVNVTIEASQTQPVEIGWYIEGDGSGAAPHSVSGTIIMDPTSNSYIWLEYPNGGESLVYGLQDSVVWSHYGSLETIDIKIQHQIGGDWETIAENIDNSGYHEFMVPGPLSDNCKIMVSSIDGETYDTSDDVFQITALNITYPVLGTVMTYTSQDSITWVDLGGVDEVNIELSTDNGFTWLEIANGVVNTGFYEFTVPGPPSENCKIKVSSTDGEVYNTSELFIIADFPIYWLIPTVTSGTIQGGEIETIPIIFNSYGLEPGTYEAFINIFTDLGQQISIPVYMDVYSLDAEPEIVSVSKLYQNYPNPFNPETTIYFTAEDAENAELIIYNLKGQKVKTFDLESASPSPFFADGHGYSISWNGTDENNKPVSSGIYFYKLKINDKVIDTKKCLLLK